MHRSNVVFEASTGSYSHLEHTDILAYMSCNTEGNHFGNCSAQEVDERQNC